MWAAVCDSGKPPQSTDSKMLLPLTATGNPRERGDNRQSLQEKVLVSKCQQHWKRTQDMDSEKTSVRPGEAEQHQKQEHKARNKKKSQFLKKGVKKELEEVFLHCESPSSLLAGKGQIAALTAKSKLC